MSSPAVLEKVRSRGRPRRGVVNLVDHLIDIYGTFSVEKLIESFTSGAPDKDIAEGFGVTTQCVGRWRRLLGMEKFELRTEVQARLAEYDIALPTRTVRTAS